jgi:hypothetical protein
MSISKVSDYVHYNVKQKMCCFSPSFELKGVDLEAELGEALFERRLHFERQRDRILRTKPLDQTDAHMDDSFVMSERKLLNLVWSILGLDQENPSTTIAWNVMFVLMRIRRASNRSMDERPICPISSAKLFQSSMRSTLSDMERGFGDTSAIQMKNERFFMRMTDDRAGPALLGALVQQQPVPNALDLKLRVPHLGKDTMEMYSKKTHDCVPTSFAMCGRQESVKKEARFEKHPFRTRKRVCGDGRIFPSVELWEGRCVVLGRDGRRMLKNCMAVLLGWPSRSFQWIADESVFRPSFPLVGLTSSMAAYYASFGTTMRKIDNFIWCNRASYVTSPHPYYIPAILCRM